MAQYKERNLWIGGPDAKNQVAITRSGSNANRTKFGSATWVYGEELGQIEAMGFSPDGSKLWYYGFDESKVPDYFLAMDVTKIQNTLDVEPYVKAGAPNPVVDVFIYDTKTKKSTPVKVRSGPFSDGVGHYVYGIEWAPDGSELWFHRTNRTQNVMEWCGADPKTGQSRVIVRESWPASWVDNTPTRQLLDQHPDIAKAPRFKGKMIWLTERNGFRNYGLVDLKSGAVQPITNHPFEVAGIEKVDLVGNKLWYMARDGENPYKLQLHRIGLDGQGDVRLTDPALSHSVDVSPDGNAFVATSEDIDSAPTTKLFDADGKAIATLAESDLTKFKELKLQPVERIEFVAADGKTPLYGTLMKPSDFDPGKKYPLLVTVYAGPESGTDRERFGVPQAMTELGFLVAAFDGRGTDGRGKSFKDSVYKKLGVVEIDDQAAGVKALRTRPYVDGNRVGIFGTSYGGYASAMAILRYPDVFQAAAASSSVTDWRNYDSIYTERYMDTPQRNPKGYDEGSAMMYAQNLKGRLLLYYGTADDNVHPANTYQLVKALQSAGKSFDLQVGPDRGHTGVNGARMLEFFVDALKPD